MIPVQGRKSQGPLKLPVEPIAGEPRMPTVCAVQQHPLLHFTQPVLPCVNAGIVDAANEVFTPVVTVSNTFCSSIVPTHDGKLVIAGGHGAVSLDCH